MTVLKEESPDNAAEVSAPAVRFRALRWTIWAAFLICWTRALLFPRPRELVPYQPILEHFIQISKAAHIGGYATFAVLSGWLFVPRPRRWFLLVWMSAHAFLTEYLQHFVEGRHPSLGDVGLNHIGIAVGLACSWAWWRRE